MEMIYMYGIPYTLGCIVILCIRNVIVNDKHRSRLDKEISEVFAKYKE